MAFSRDNIVGTSWGMHLGTRERASIGGGVVSSGGLLGRLPFKRFNFLVLRAADEKQRWALQEVFELIKKEGEEETGAIKPNQGYTVWRYPCG